LKLINFSNIKDFLNKNLINFSTTLDDNFEIKGINSIIKANKYEICFYTDKKYFSELSSIKAAACFIDKNSAKYLNNNCTPIIVENPYLCFAHLSNYFMKNIFSNGIISKYINLSNNVKLDKNVQIDSFCNIYENTYIKNNVIIGSNSSIGPNVIIDEHTRIGPNVSISNSHIHNSCLIKSGAVIGGKGFGFEENSKIPIQHFGNVIINSNCSIGSNTTIDRAVFDSTIIGENSHIDNLVQIAHNVIIGRHAIIAAQVGIAGSSTIGDNIKIGGQSGISGHLKIGKNVIVAAKSGVTKNLEDNSIVAGFPAIDINKWKLNIIKLNKLK